MLDDGIYFSMMKLRHIQPNWFSATTSCTTQNGEGGSHPKLHFVPVFGIKKAKRFTDRCWAIFGKLTAGGSRNRSCRRHCCFPSSSTAYYSSTTGVRSKVVDFRVLPHTFRASRCSMVC
jgi:hypothetical protein